MTDAIEFDEIVSGTWIKGSDMIDAWVLFQVIGLEDRVTGFGDETVATVDFANLTAGDSSVRRVLISDRHIVSKLARGKTIVGLIRQLPSKQKGWKGAIILDQPAGDDYEKAKNSARAILSGPSKPAPAPQPPKDDLEDLLGDF